MSNTTAQARIHALSRHLVSASDNASPILDPPTPPLRLMTDEELATYCRDGVVCMKNAIPDAVVQHMKKCVDGIKGEPNEMGQTTAMNAWHTDDNFRDMVLNHPACYFANQVFQAAHGGSRDQSVRFLYDQMFVKWPNHTSKKVAFSGKANSMKGNNTPWHHDVTFWPIRGDKIVSAWFPLDKTNLENGALEFVRRSHLWKERFKAYGADLDFPSDVLSELPKLFSATNGDDVLNEGYGSENPVTTFVTEPGDVLIFSPLVLHGAPGNASPRPRRGIALRYFGTRPLHTHSFRHLLTHSKPPPP